MDRVQQIVPISDMKLKHAQVLGLLSKGPVVLAQRSKPAAVLVSVAQWDAQADELARLRRIVEYDRQFAEMDAGNFVKFEDIDKELAALDARTSQP
jgi:prevent-host-death family protein